MESPYSEPAKRDHALHLGVWIFLGSETLLFAGLFALYAAYRAGYAGAFLEAASHNTEWIGTLNTYVLIVSSFFVALAVHALRADRRRLAIGSLAVTLLLGATFLSVKAYEYHDHLSHGIAPGAYYDYAELPTHAAMMFFSMYYAMTGLHAIHVLAGMAILAYMIFAIRRRTVTPDRVMPLEAGGLYWHLVDVVWIFLWPLLYLTG